MLQALTASVIMVEPVCRTREVPRNSGSVAFAVFPPEVFGAGIYSSTIIYGSVGLTNAVGTLRLLENCVKHGIRKVVFASTGGAMYDCARKLRLSEDTALPSWDSPRGQRLGTNLLGIPLYTLRCWSSSRQKGEA